MQFFFTAVNAKLDVFLTQRTQGFFIFETYYKRRERKAGCFFNAANAKLKFFFTQRTQGFFILKLIINEEIAKLEFFLP